MDYLDYIEELHSNSIQIEKQAGGVISLKIKYTENNLKLIRELRAFDSNLCVEQNNLQMDLERSSTDVTTPLYVEIKNNQVFLDWKHFLSQKNNICKAPKDFVILDSKIRFSRDEQSNEDLKNYLNITRLINILSEVSDHSDMLNDYVIKSVMILHKSKLLIPVNYSYTELKNHLIDPSAITSLLKESSHKEQKKSIIKASLYSLLSKVEPSKRLPYLIEHFGEFSSRVLDNYNLFVSDFSFDKVRIEYEENKREYFAKINSVFSSTQTRMLGLPISLALASTKLSPHISKTNLVETILVLAAISLYLYMMKILLENQKSTIETMQSEYSGKMKRLSFEYPKQYDDIKQVEATLNTRVQRQLDHIGFFNGAITTVAISLCIFAFYSAYVSFEQNLHVLYTNLEEYITAVFLDFKDRH